MKAWMLAALTATHAACGTIMRDGAPHGTERCAAELDKHFHKSASAGDREREAVARLDQPTPELCACLRDHPSSGSEVFHVSFTVPAGDGEASPESLTISGNGRESPLAACLGATVAARTFPAGPVAYAIDYALNVAPTPRSP